MKKIGEIIPRKLLHSGYDLKMELGINEKAWNYQDAIEIINYLEKNNYRILGGDVYAISNKSIEITYDNWFFAEKEGENLVYKSARKAKEYMCLYQKKYGDKFIYSIIFSDSEDEIDESGKIE